MKILQWPERFVLTAGWLLFTVAGAQAFQPPAGPELPNFDNRAGGAQVSAMVERGAAVSALRACLPGARVDFDECTGTPKWVVAEQGFLSGPGGQGLGIGMATAAIGAGEEHHATKSFLREHQSLLGFGPDALALARLKHDAVTKHNGLRTVVWEQELDGIAVFEGVMISHATKNEELVNLSSQFIPNPEAAAEAGTPNRATLLGSPPIPAARAVALAAQNLGEVLEEAEVTAVEELAEGPEQRRHFRAPPLNGEVNTKLVWLPMDQNSLRLCWEVELTSRARGEMFKILVDAQTGEALVRHCLTEYLSDASYRVFTSDSPSPFSPACPSLCTTQPPLMARTLVTLSALDTNASPAGWIDDGGNETRGNNVDAHTDRDANNSPDLPRPQGAPFRTFDFPLDLTQAPATYTNAAVTDLFFWCNWIHDQLYDLGFTESARNFQVNNFGRGGLGNDALQADAQDGGGFNNANMSTPSDGSPPRMQMYVFNGPTPDRDGDFDHEIVIHEYVHGLSNRRVGGGGGLSATQSRGMGEGWSDWYALTLLSEPGDDVNGVFAKGGYATYLLSGMTQNYYFGIRRYPYSTDLTKNPLTFRDIDPGQASAHAGIPRSPIIGNTASEVHNQGEVWCVTLWEARANLIAKYGYAAGNQLILQLVTDGMNLSPPNPNFLQARDAILQADIVSNGGADLGELWAAFAKRGMGYSATSPSSSTTTGVVEAYDIPDSLSVTPSVGFTGAGPVGGPFTPNSTGFTLINVSTNAVNWSGSSTATWLSLSQTSGVIAAGGSNSFGVTVNVSANLLPLGVYNGTVRVTNGSSGVIHSRAFTLRVGQPDYFTELFDGGDNDLDFQTLTLTPDGSAHYYSACREPALVFPTDPTSATNLSLGAHTYTTLTLATNISIYGINANTIHLASEGHLTLLSGDASGTVTLANHFSRPRVSASFAHIHPTESGGRVSWMQLSNRVVFTFDRVVEWSTTKTNSFQIELFHDGRIRMTHLACATTTGLVGLSAGAGVPAGFIESDLSSYGPCVQPLAVSVPPNATEGDGLLTGQLNIFSPATTNVTVTLISSAPSQATVPATVTIFAGATSTNFNLTIRDDPDLDGVQPATITASAPGYAFANGTVQIADNETAGLTLSVPALATEGVGTVTGMVLASAPPTADIAVSLSSGDPTEIQVPPTVFLPAGQTSAVFTITVVNDTEIDGDQPATITAQVANWTDGSGSLTVRDNEPTNLTVILPASAREGNGVLVGAGTVRIAGTLTTNLEVSLLSGDTTELTVPTTATIPAGKTFATFNLTVVDDPDVDSSQSVTVTASAPGFTSGSTNLTVTDDESPPEPFNPSPAHLATNVVQTADLAWQSGALAGETITNDVYFGTNPAPGPAELLGSTTNSNWSLPTLAPLTTYYWQIVARKTGFTPGPVWQFTTRGVDHFVWDAIPSPQFVSQPFAATVTAKDVFETTVSNFTGTVALSALAGGGVATNTILGSQVHSNSSTGSWTAGYSFTPNVNLSVTHVRHYFGTKVSIWTDAGTLLATQNVRSTSGTWLETPLTAPIHLIAGTRYRVASYTGGGSIHWRNDLPGSFGQGTIDQGYEISGDNFPTTTDTIRWMFVDLRYTVGSTLPIAITPTNSGNFVNGAWTGNLAALAPTTNLVLRAEDGSGHVGTSNPFAVELHNDISVTLADSPDPVSLGGNVTYTITVTNIGPASASDVTVTNVLPATASLVSVATSQGTATTNGSVVTCLLGSMAGNASATVSIVAQAIGVGTLNNQVFVARSDADAYPANNSAVVTTAVQSPVIAINDVTLYEGNSGTVNAAFTVTVSPAPALVTTVNFATASGAAVAPGDFVSTNGTLTFAPGETNQTVRVAVNGDPLYELNESFTVNLSGATNANLADSQGVGTILNDDAMPMLSIGDVLLQEGNLGITNAVFSVYLSAPSGLDVTVNYATANGNATSGSDYVAKSGSLTIPAGSTSTNIVITVNRDLLIEFDEVFYVDLSSAANAFLLKREGYGLIVNDDGLPGNVDHFIWSSITSPQYVNHPFGVTITALDAFGNPAVNFTNAASLTGLGNGGLATNTILPGPIPNNSRSGSYTLGYSFTPTNDLTVTHVRSCFGTKISIWTDGGVLLASQAISSTGGTWTETPLASPLTLTAGSTYRVAAYTGGGTYYWRTDGSNSFPNGNLNQGYEASGDTFPSSSDSVRWWAVDLRYLVGTPISHPISPIVTGPFVNGLWSGNITALAPTTNLVLRADDGDGHAGNSGAFAVWLYDDVAISVTDTPDPVAVGANLTYSISVTNTGPSAATGVVVVNVLPPEVTLISVTQSQGTHITIGPMVFCTFGTMSGGSPATVSLLVTPASAGVVTNFAIIARAEADNWAGNNAATNTTAVIVPALTINDAGVGEPNGTATNGLFNVTLSAASPYPVTVNYATANGTALAGSDYTATNGTLSFGPGQTNQVVLVEVLDDAISEPNETFTVTLSGAVNAALDKAVGTGTIFDNDGPPEFQIVNLFATNSKVVDHNSQTGDDRGGVAISTSQVFVTGDNATARFAAADLTGGTSLGIIRDSLCTDLRTETVYALGNGSTPLTSSGGTVTTIIELSGTTGQPTGVVLPLSQSFSMTSSGNGIFSGYGRIVVHNGTRVYDIYLPTGTVTDRGAMTRPAWYPSESWSVWGVAEYFGGTLYLTYRDSATQRIVRSRIPDGVVTAVATFSNLSDLASFTVSPSRNRWYFHYEGGGQFGGSSETLGYADAQFSFNSATPPVIATQPIAQAVAFGGTASFNVTAFGGLPLAYQWRFHGTNLPGQTATTLSLLNVQSNQAGPYSVIVTNAYGSVTSSIATLTILPQGSGIAYLRSTIGSPWGTTTNESALNRVFGAGNWQDLRFETAVVGTLFSPANGFIFMDGSDNGAAELEAFINSSRVLMEGWVAGGGRLFLNAAPNEDNGMYFGFGASLVYPDATSQGRAATAAHPIFNGPFLPVGTNWTGSSFGHATVTGTNLVTLITNTSSGRSVLAEQSYGAGRVLFGGMTTHNFHSPATEAANLRANILYYGNTPVLVSNQPPQITSQPAGQTVALGGTAVFNVTASGSAPLTYQWRQGGTNLVEGGPLSGTSSNRLTILNVRTNDAGLYSVAVSNLYGAVVSSNATLTVNVPPPPVVPSNPVPTNFAAGVSVHASVSWDNSPNRFYVYFGTNAGALPLLATNLTQTTFDPGTLAFNTTYYWQVVASNIVGSVTGAVWQFTTTLDEVHFAAATSSVAENGGLATITVTRENPAGGLLSVQYATTNGTATAGADYTAVSGTLQFPAGVLSTNFQVPILDDATGEGLETVLLRLSQPSANVLLAAPSNAVLTIVDNDAVQVSLLFDPAYVDTTIGVGGEATNVIAALVAKGCLVQTFTGITATVFSTVLAGADILYIPELANGDLGLALSAAAKGVISNFVAGGGGLIINGEAGSWDENFINQVFGHSIASGSWSNSTALTGAAAGTAFAGGPASLRENFDTYEWLRSSLPAGSLSIYQDSGALYTTVAVIPRGAGKIVFLAYDWFNAVPRGMQDGGWDEVLRRALLVATPALLPVIAGDGHISANGQFAFTVNALPGAIVVIEASTNLIQWTPIHTNVVGEVGAFLFHDLKTGAYLRRFYRAHLYQGVLAPPAIQTFSGSTGAIGEGQFGFEISGAGGQIVVIEASTNLVTWTPIETNTVGIGPIYFRDPDSSTFPFRFYRTRLAH